MHSRALPSPLRHRSGSARHPGPPPPSVARRRRCHPLLRALSLPGTRSRPAPGRPCSAGPPRPLSPPLSPLVWPPGRGGREQPEEEPQPGGGGPSPWRTVKEAARRKCATTMTVGGPGTCGGAAGRARRGGGRAPPGALGGWLSAGTGTRPTRLRDRGPGTPARAPPLGSSARARGGLGCTASGRSPRNPSRYPGPDCTKPAAWSSAPRPRPLPRSPGPPSGGRRSVCAALPASPGTPPLGWGCGGVTAGGGPSSQSGAVSLVSCVDSIPRLCSRGSLSATFLGVQMERLRLARWTIKGC